MDINKLEEVKQLIFQIETTREWIRNLESITNEELENLLCDPLVDSYCLKKDVGVCLKNGHAILESKFEAL